MKKTYKLPEIVFYSDKLDVIVMSGDTFSWKDEWNTEEIGQ